MPKLSLTLGGDWTEDESESAADSLVAINAAAVTSHASAVAAAATFTAPGGATFAYDQRFLTGIRTPPTPPTAIRYRPERTFP